MDTPTAPGIRFASTIDPLGYVVGDDGSVWSRFAAKGRFDGGWRRLSVKRRKDGLRYCRVQLRANQGRGRRLTRYVHRLVLEAFIGPCPDGQQALHGDRDTANNRLTNLRWGTPAENAADKYRHGTIPSGVAHPRAAMSDVDVLVIGYLARKRSIPHDEIADIIGSDQTSVSRILRGERYQPELALAEACLRDGLTAAIRAGAIPRKQLRGA